MVFGAVSAVRFAVCDSAVAECAALDQIGVRICGMTS